MGIPAELSHGKNVSRCGKPDNMDKIFAVDVVGNDARVYARLDEPLADWVVVNLSKNYPLVCTYAFDVLDALTGFWSADHSGYDNSHIGFFVFE